MRSRWIGAAVVVSLGLALGGVAGASTADKQKPLSKKDFIRTGDSICKQSDQLAGKAFDALKVDPQSTTGQLTTEQLQSFMDTAGPIFQQEVDSLRALPAPKADAKKLKKIFNLVQKGFNAWKAHPRLVLGSTPALTKASKKAKAYGFKVCGQ